MPRVLRYVIVANVSLESTQIIAIAVSLSATAFEVLTVFSTETSEWTKPHEYMHSPSLHSKTKTWIRLLGKCIISKCD